MPEKLPSEAERNEMLAALAEVIAACGADRFLGAPLVRPEPRFFPDVWHDDERGPRRIAKRLLRLAALPEVVPEVRLGAPAVERKLVSRVGGFGVDTSKDGPGVAIGQVDESSCVIWVDEDELADREHLAGLLAREIARVYMMVRGLEPEDAGDAEALVDVIAVYLGFGLLTVNASWRVRTRLELDEHLASTFSRKTSGAFSPEALAFLLAAHTLARRTRARDVRASLETRQAEAFPASVEALEGNLDALDKALGISPEARATASPIPLDSRPLLGEGDDAPARARSPAREWNNELEPVFRVVHRMTLSLGFVGFLVGVLAVIPESAHFHTGYSLILGVVVGGLLGRSIRRYRCSFPECGSLLRREDVTCPVCGGRIIGELENLRDRFDAEREWRAQNRLSEAAERDLEDPAVPDRRPE